MSTNISRHADCRMGNRYDGRREAAPGHYRHASRATRTYGHAAPRAVSPECPSTDGTRGLAALSAPSRPALLARARSAGRILAFVALAAAALPAHGHAQLSKLKNAAKQAVAGTAGNATTSADGANAGTATTAGPRFNDFILEMTPEVVTRIEAALAAESADRTEVAAILARQPDPQQREICAQRAATLPEMQKALDTYLVDLEKANGDNDAIMKAAQKMDAAMRAVIDRECGVQLTPEQERELQARPHLAGAKAGGFTDRQFAFLKERIPPFCAAGAKLETDDNGASVPVDYKNRYVYSTTEVAALGPKCGTLMPAIVK